MAVLPIRIYPDPVLRVRCQPVEVFDADLEELARNMIETMRAAPGIGLAASQVGVEKRLAVVDPSAGEHEDELLVLVNPELLESTGEEADVEGCLSIPGLSEKVPRATHVRIAAQSLSGERFELEAEALLARVIQHEMDHLDGVLFVDRLRGLRRERSRRFLRRLQSEEEVSA